MTHISSQALGRYVDHILRGNDAASSNAGGDFALLFALPLMMTEEGAKATTGEPQEFIAQNTSLLDIIGDHHHSDDHINHFNGDGGDGLGSLTEGIFTSPEVDQPQALLETEIDLDREAIATPLVPVMTVPEDAGVALENAGEEGIEAARGIGLLSESDIDADTALPNNSQNGQKAMLRRGRERDDRAALKPEFNEEVEISQQVRNIREAVKASSEAAEAEPRARVIQVAPAPEVPERRSARRLDASLLNLSDVDLSDGVIDTKTRILTLGNDDITQRPSSDRIDRPQISLNSVSVDALAKSSGGPSDPRPAGVDSQLSNPMSASNAQSEGTLLDFMKRDWQEKLGARLSASIDRGEQEIDLQLHPKSLGKLKISLAMAEGELRVKMVAETSLTASLLSDAEARLAQSLEQSGLRLAQFSATWSGGRHSQDQQDDQQRKSARQSDKNKDNLSETIHGEVDLVNSARNVHPNGINVTA